MNASSAAPLGYHDLELELLDLICHVGSAFVPETSDEFAQRAATLRYRSGKRQWSKLDFGEALHVLLKCDERDSIVPGVTLDRSAVLDLRSLVGIRHRRSHADAARTRDPASAQDALSDAIVARRAAKQLIEAMGRFHAPDHKVIAIVGRLDANVAAMLKAYVDRAMADADNDAQERAPAPSPEMQRMADVIAERVCRELRQQDSRSKGATTLTLPEGSLERRYLSRIDKSVAQIARKLDAQNVAQNAEEPARGDGSYAVAPLDRALTAVETIVPSRRSADFWEGAEPDLAANGLIGGREPPPLADEVDSDSAEPIIDDPALEALARRAVPFDSPDEYGGYDDDEDLGPIDDELDRHPPPADFDDEETAALLHVNAEAIRADAASSVPAPTTAERLAQIKALLSRVNTATRSLSRSEARDALIDLRRTVWEETGRGASTDGLLRKGMLDEFLQRLPRSREDASWVLQRHVSPAELPYLDRVLEITRRVIG